MAMRTSRRWLLLLPLIVCAGWHKPKLVPGAAIGEYDAPPLLTLEAKAAANCRTPNPPQSGSLMEEYAQAWRLICEKRTDDAIETLQDIIAKDRSFHRAYKLLARAYDRKGIIDQAEQYFRRLLDRDPTNGWANYGISEVYERKCGTDFLPTASEPERSNWAAIRAQQSVRGLELAPQVFQLYKNLAGGLAGQTATVRAQIERRINLDPSTAYASLLLVHLDLSQSKYREAVEAAATGLERAQALHEPELEAELHTLLASSRISTGAGYDQARMNLLQAGGIFQQLGDWEGEMETGLSLIEANLYLGNHDEAVSECEHNLARSRQMGNCYWEMRYLVALGRCQATQGEHAGAIRAYEEAREIAVRIGEMTFAEQWLRTIGEVYRQQGDLQEAARSFQESGKLAGQINARFDQALTYRALGNLFYDVGDYFKAVQFGSESARVFQEDGRPHQAGASLGNVGLAYSALGDYATAKSHYEQALHSAEKFGDMSERQDTLNRLGDLCLRMGRPADALPYLNKALHFSEETKYVPYRITILLNLAGANRQLGKHNVALEYINEAVSLSREIGAKPLEAASLADMGDCYLGLGELEKAEQAFASSLALSEPIGLSEISAAGRRGLGAVYRRKGAYDKSYEQLRLAIELIERMRGYIPASDLRSSFVAQNWKAYEEIIEILSLLRQPNASRTSPGAREDYVSKAFTYSERGRARSFLEMLEAGKAGLTRNIMPEQSRLHAALLAEASKAWLSLLKADTEQNRQAFKKADSDLKTWETERKRSYPKYEEAWQAEPYTAEKARTALTGQNAILLEYSLGTRHSYLWLVAGTKIFMASLPGRSEIERRVAEYRKLITRHPRNSEDFEAYKTLARQLYDLLLAPLRKYPDGTRKLVIVPDGVLHYLPFETLIESETGRYLIEQFTVTYAPSAGVFGSLLDSQRKENKSAGRRELIAFAASDFGVSAPSGKADVQKNMGDLVRGTYREKGFSFTPLPNTRVEVEAIANLYPADRSKIYLGQAATEAAVKSERLAEYKRVHFATHAIVDELLPSRSGIVMSLVNTGEEDGILTIPEILALNLNADLVVLSACKTGLGKLVRGEGMLGLTRAFMSAGSPRVVVSLWEVNDIATAGFSRNFYQEMKAGNDIAHALRAAKLAMIASESPAYRHPYFWAPFILSGLF